jgi:curved DNA-binding protein CbpA
MYKESYYGLLRLPLNATADQVRAKALQLEQVHVELACAGNVQAVLRLREIREARSVLCDPTRRATYDQAYVAAITAHLRYVPPRPGEAPVRENWLVFHTGANAS